MQMNEGGRPGMNPYMRPMGRSSLLSTPAPLTPVQPAPAQQYTPNEPEDEAPAFSRPLIFVEAPKADPAWADEPTELDSAAEPTEDPAPEAEELPVEEPASRLFVELPEEPADEPIVEESPAYEQMPLVILPVEEEPEAEEKAEEVVEEVAKEPVVELPAEEAQPEDDPADEPVERMVELPEELPLEMEEEDAEEAEEPADQLNPWLEPVDYAAAYAMSRMAPEAEQPQPELPQEEPAPRMAEEFPEETVAQPENGEPAYDFDPAYYAAYWQQWQNAMEAHQAATCSACPLLNNQRGKVCYVPVIIPEGTDVDPEAVLSLRNAAPKVEDAPLPQEDDLFPAPQLPDEDDIDDGFDDEDEDFTGEDAMATEDMPTPQTVPVSGPDLGPKKKKSRKWPWVLLVLLLLLVGGVFTLSRTGHLQAVVDWLGLPESVVEWLRDITLL